ncbi:hypothetical protein IFM89_007488 [Coptis chinensis]|uniref:Membrane magnesium transporter n=1 Tax=Coptis chinensis TaxID=261450 RepID=A0A835LIL4_9MAGN|nr:hypothetical protein IFM89_007488 [Coptis chinensis]
MNSGFGIGIVGVLILFHAAYSTIQYRTLLKILEEEFSSPPFQVVLELILGLVFCLWAALTVPGKFLSIQPDSDENRIGREVVTRVAFGYTPIRSEFDLFPALILGCKEVSYGIFQKIKGSIGRIVSLPENLDFMIFNHRGRAFPTVMDAKLKC